MPLEQTWTDEEMTFSSAVHQNHSKRGPFEWTWIGRAVSDTADDLKGEVTYGYGRVLCDFG